MLSPNVTNFNILCLINVLRLLELAFYECDSVIYFRKLVTNQGKGYHIRCKYAIKERTLNNKFEVG